MTRRMLAALTLVAVLFAGAFAEAATITPTITAASGTSGKVYSWSGMAGADTPVSAPASDCIDLTVQVSGTFGTTTVTLQGSMDDATYATLNDTSGTPAALSFTAAAFKHVQEKANYLRPGLSGGTGTGLKVAVLWKTS